MPVIFLEAKKIMMTIKKKWLITLVSIGVLAIIITTIIFSFFMRNFFMDFVETNYQSNIEELKNYSEMVIVEDQRNNRQLQISLRNYLDDPIALIELYDGNGNMIAKVQQSPGMMMGHMREQSDEFDTYELTSDTGEIIGMLAVGRTSSIPNSAIFRDFNRTLITNSIFSGLAVLLLLIIASLWISQRMSKSLIQTAKDAKEADLKVINYHNPSNIEEIYAIQKSLSDLSKKLKLKANLRKKSVDSIVHQTRTPLTVLKSNIEGSLDQIVTLDEERLETLLHQIDQLTVLIDQLDEQIIEMDDTLEPTLNNINLNSITKKIVKGLELKFNKKAIQLNYSYTGEEFVTTDESLIIQTLYNLLDNAYKYTSTNGTVDLTIANENHHFIVTVSDNGIGIPTKEQQEIFKSYYRGSQTTSTDGEGLGLFIVQKNVNALDGRITINSQEGVGTTITIKIPK